MKKFPCLASISSDLHDDDLALYGGHLENLHDDIQAQFSGILTMNIPTWVRIPFEVYAADIDISLQETLTELQSGDI